MARRRRTARENEAIKAKQRQLKSEGIRSDRATAAAFRMYRDGELNLNQTPTMTKTLKAKRTEIRANGIDMFLSSLAMKRAQKRRTQRRIARQKKK